jgi:hypothetical protein
LFNDECTNTKASLDDKLSNLLLDDLNLIFVSFDISSHISSEKSSKEFNPVPTAVPPIAILFMFCLPNSKIFGKVDSTLCIDNSTCLENAENSCPNDIGTASLFSFLKYLVNVFFQF